MANGYRRKILSIAALLLVGVCLSASSEPAMAQVTSQTFKLRYAWGYTSLAQVRGGIDKWPLATFQINSNGTISTGTTQAYAGTWTLVGNQITFNFAFNGGSSTYVGTLQTDGNFTGSMTNGNGWYGVWKGRFYP